MLRAAQTAKRRVFGLWALLNLLLVVALLGGCATAEQKGSRTDLPHAQVPPVQEQPDATSAAQPVPADPTTKINITQQEYADALAKWRLHAVVEYDITFQDSTYMLRGGKLKLRFKVEQSEPTLVRYTDLSGEQPRIIPLAGVPSDELEFLQGRSVEGMFALLGMVLAGDDSNPEAFGNEYDVAFDPALGYPLHVYSRAVAPGLGPVSDCCISYKVLSIQIIKSSAPGMPKTGAPSP
jgi:hypothetical protein